jgi:hypothetical protein
MKEMFLAFIAFCAIAVTVTISISPKPAPCDGQLVTGAIGTIEFRYCVHPVVAQ